MASTRPNSIPKHTYISMLHDPAINANSKLYFFSRMGAFITFRDCRCAEMVLEDQVSFIQDNPTLSINDFFCLNKVLFIFSQNINWICHASHCKKKGIDLWISITIVWNPITSILTSDNYSINIFRKDDRCSSKEQRSTSEKHMLTMWVSINPKLILIWSIYN